MKAPLYLWPLVIVALVLSIARIAQQPIAPAGSRDIATWSVASTPYDAASVVGIAPLATHTPATPTEPPLSATVALVAIETPVRLATPTPVVVRAAESSTGPLIYGSATHYGESYDGRPMGCGGTYYSSDPLIIAVAYPSRNTEWPCGTELIVEGPGGSLRARRTDACPGCGPNTLDLSEAGSQQVCGFVGNCAVTIRRAD